MKIKEYKRGLFRIFGIFLLMSMVFGGCFCDNNDEKDPWNTSLLVAFGNTPVFSPDGEKIAFIGEDGEAHGLYVYEFGTGSQLVLEGYYNYDYAWSPGSDKIALSDPGGSLHNLLVTDLEGNVEVIAENGKNPDWSPDGQYIVYQDGYGTGLYVVESGGGTSESLNFDGEGPKYSPDGSIIAYSVGVNLTSTIRLWDVSTGVSSHLVYGGPNFDWSPDGGSMVYDVHENLGSGGVNDIRVTAIINPDGDLIWQGGADPEYSPDGSLIVFRSYSGFNEGGLVVIPAEGGSAELVNDIGFSPSFGPNGDMIAFSADESGIYLAVKND